MRTAVSALLMIASCCAHATIYVNTDSGAHLGSGGPCSLPDAIASVTNAFPYGGCPIGQATDTIELPSNAVIVLTVKEPRSQAAGLPELGANIDLTIIGHGARIERSAALGCPRDGQPAAGKFRLIENGGTLRLSDVTLANGCADDPDGESGGAIDNTGRLDIQRVRFVNNTARFGGAIASLSDKTSTIGNSEFVGNTAVWGGALSHRVDTFDIGGVVFHGNVATDDPGGPLQASGSAISSAGNLRLFNSTVSGNLDHGARHDAGAVQLDYGNAVAVRADLSFVTIADNEGIGLRKVNAGTVLALANSIVANSGGADCSGIDDMTVQHVGRNVFSDAGSCAVTGAMADLHSTDPRLAPLGDYGGGTLTRALRATSPAIDASTNCMTTTGGFPAADQRNVPRPQGVACDVGAFEFEPPLFASGFE